MVIDFHTHIFPAKLAAGTIRKLESMSGLTAMSDGTKEGLEKSMRKADVSLSVILPVITRPEQFEHLNRYAREITQEHFDGRGPEVLSFGAVHPDSPDYREQLRKIRDMGLKGIKIHPDYFGVDIDDPRMLRLIDEASAQGLIISIHAGIDVGMPEHVHCPPKKAAAMLDAVRPVNCILAHMGGWMQWDEVERYLLGRDVWMDTSMAGGYIDDEQMKRMVRIHGADHLLFGTDSPWGGQKEGITYIRSLGLKKEDEEAILWKNAAELLGIKC